MPEDMQGEVACEGCSGNESELAGLEKRKFSIPASRSSTGSVVLDGVDKGL